MKLRIVHSGLMSFVLCSLMTCWVTFINLGLSEHFPGLWLKAFLLAWPMAYLIAFSCGPAVMRLTHRLVGVQN